MTERVRFSAWRRKFAQACSANTGAFARSGLTANSGHPNAGPEAENFDNLILYFIILDVFFAFGVPAADLYTWLEFAADT